MFILQVIPITKSFNVPQLSYFSARGVEPGTLVTIPVRKQEVLAVVIKKDTLEDLKSVVRSATYQLRNVLEIHKEKIFGKAFFEAVIDTASYHVCSPGNLLHTLLPSALVKDIRSFEHHRTKAQKEGNIQHRTSLLQQPTKERLSYYKTRAREILARGTSLYLCCPTIESSRQVFEYISAGIQDSCFLLHGEVRKSQLKNYHQHLNSGSPSIVVGTPGYVALATEDTQEFIIERSSSSHYTTSFSRPYLDMRTFIERRAYHGGAHCIYADTIIDLSLWERTETGRVETIPPVRNNVLDGGRIKVLRFTNEEQTEEDRIEYLKYHTGGFKPLHYQSMKAVKTSMKNKEKVFLFVPKKGLAPNLVCQDCGKVATSPESGYPYSLYMKENRQTKKKEPVYICNATGEQVPAFDQCQFCKGVNLKKLGIATNSLAAELELSFPNIPVLVVDSSSVKTKKELKRVRNICEQEGPLIIVGTSKALSVCEEVNTTIVVSVTPLLSVFGYRNDENLLYLISQLQEKTRGFLYFQDRQDIALRLPILTQGIYHSFLEHERSVRKQFSYPPYVILIKVENIISKKKVKEVYNNTLTLFKQYDPGIVIQPKSRTMVRLITLLKLEKSMWSLTYQDPHLKELLKTYSQIGTIEINPRNLG